MSIPFTPAIMSSNENLLARSGKTAQIVPLVINFRDYSDFSKRVASVELACAVLQSTSGTPVQRSGSLCLCTNNREVQEVLNEISLVFNDGCFNLCVERSTFLQYLLPGIRL